MHFVNCWVAPAQLLPHCCVVWDSPEATGELFWGAASAGAEEPPPNMPPMAWPMEEPIATPAAVLAIWPKRPGPCEGAAAAGGGAACCWGGAAMDEAGRDWTGAGFAAETVGREGAALGRPAES